MTVRLLEEGRDVLIRGRLVSVGDSECSILVPMPNGQYQRVNTSYDHLFQPESPVALYEATRLLIELVRALADGLRAQSDLAHRVDLVAGRVQAEVHEFGAAATTVTIR